MLILSCFSLDSYFFISYNRYRTLINKENEMKNLSKSVKKGTSQALAYTHGKGEWLSICKRSFKNLQELSNQFKTWKDVQKSDLDFKSHTWKNIKNFRTHKHNDKPYIFIDHKCYGWCTNEWNYIF